MMATISLSALPIWLAALMLVVLPVAIAIGSALLVRRGVGLERLIANNEVAGFKFAVVGVIYAVLLGFAVIVVWERFHDAESTATREAGAVVALGRLSGGLYGPAREPAHAADAAQFRAHLYDYLRVTVDDEWPAMSRGEASPKVRAALDGLYAELLGAESQTRSSAVVLAEMLHQLDQVTFARRERLQLARGIVPPVVWAALVLGAVFTIGFTFFFGVRSMRAQALMTGVLSALIFLGLLVIVSIDHPFTGPVSVSAEPLRSVLLEVAGE